MNRRQLLYQIAGEGRLALKDEEKYQAIAVWLYLWGVNFLLHPNTLLCKYLLDYGI